MVSAITIYALREIPKRQASARISAPSVAKTIWEGWQFLGHTVVVRGLVIGMVGAFAAGGVVVGLGPSYIRNTLNGGSAGWGAVFTAIFVGLAAGMFLGLRILRGFSRRRLFGLSIVGAGIPLVLIGLIPNLVIVVFLVVLLGAFAGIAYVTGYTIVGTEVDDETRGRTFAFLQSGIRVILFAVIAIAPLLAAGFTALVHAVSGGNTLRIAHIDYAAVGYNIVLMLSAIVAVWLGVVSYQQMDDRRGVPLRDDLVAAVRGEPFTPVPGHPNGTQPHAAPRRGLLIAFEGGEGAGKSSQARLLAIWLRDQGYDVIATHEPGATKVGMRLRALLLDTSHAGLTARAETLMYAADRAEHVETVIVPALERGSVVVTDRYVDSSIAYQGRGRNQPVSEVAGLNKWATGGVEPDLTILLDLPPAAGLNRRVASADRLEAEPAEFHERVREGFLAQAAAAPERYLVLDATKPPGELSVADPGTGPRPAARSGAVGGRRLDREFPGHRGMTGTAVFGDLVGQEDVVAELRRAAGAAAAVLRGEPATGMTHAWLFTGPPGSGRSVAARAFAAALLCEDGGCGQCPSCHQVRAGTHADLLLVRPDGLSYGVRQTRNLVLRAAGAPSGGRWRVVLFEDADRATEQAANALLKAIEEPAPRTVWLLCAPSAEELVTTIRSRCRLVVLRTPPADGVAGVLTAEGVDPERALAAARAAQGHIGRARRLATDPQAARRRDEVLAVPPRLSGVGPALRRRRGPGQGRRGGGRRDLRRARPARARSVAPGVRRRLDRQGGGQRRPGRGGRSEGTGGPAEVPGDPAEARRARPRPARPGGLLP